MAFQSGVDWKIETDVDQYLTIPTETPDFQELCVTTANDALNEIVDTFHRLCDGGLSSNKVTGLDPQFDIAVKGDKLDTVLQAILGIRFTTERTYPFKITDPFTDEIIDFNGEITAISSVREIGTVIEFSITIKLADGAIVIT